MKLLHGFMKSFLKSNFNHFDHTFVLFIDLFWGSDILWSIFFCCEKKSIMDMLQNVSFFRSTKEILTHKLNSNDDRILI